jgi:hypothetical protein
MQKKTWVFYLNPQGSKISCLLTLPLLLSKLQSIKLTLQHCSSLMFLVIEGTRSDCSHYKQWSHILMDHIVQKQVKFLMQVYQCSLLVPLSIAWLGSCTEVNIHSISARWCGWLFLDGEQTPCWFVYLGCVSWPFPFVHCQYFAYDKIKVHIVSHNDWIML